MNDVTSKIPRVSVKAVFCSGEYVLYLKNTKGVRDIPGGHIEFGETVLEALKRELKEELDYNLDKEPKLLHVWTYINKERSAHRVNIVYLINLTERILFKYKESNDTEVIWLHKNEIKKQEFLPEMEGYLLKAVSGIDKYGNN